VSTALRSPAHGRVPINRLFCVNENLVATGDDDGVIKVNPPSEAALMPSSGTHGSKSQYALTPSTLTTFPISRISTTNAS
jgi:hypothetical protein